MRMKAEAQGERKFRDNRDTTGTAGQGPKFRDCPGHSGTVGNYVYRSALMSHFSLVGGIDYSHYPIDLGWSSGISCGGARRAGRVFFLEPLST